MNTYEEKMIDEHDCLEEKLSKLLLYVDSDSFDELPDEDASLIEQQLSAMIEYLQVLSLRIDKFETNI